MGAPKIAHVITDLNGFGGTEATLLRYVESSAFAKECHRVFVLKSTGTANTIGAQMCALGVTVVALNQKKGSITPYALWRLYRELRAFSPDVVSGWLYHPSLLASILAKLLMRRPQVVWHIRSLPFASLSKTPGRYFIQRALALLSHRGTQSIVSNSHTAMKKHGEIGFCVSDHNWKIIPNGLDTSKYYPSAEDYAEVRAELDIPEDALIVGCVGRFVPEKGYRFFWEALGQAFSKLPAELVRKVHVVAVGNGVEKENPVFMSLVPGNLARERLHLLGKRADVPRLLRAVDVFVLPSISEAFPNALVEAMATGAACLATNVGECANVVPAPEMIVPPGEAVQLGQKLTDLMQLTRGERRRLGEISRNRIEENFTLSKMVAQFDELFERMANGQASNEMVANGESAACPK